MFTLIGGVFTGGGRDVPGNHYLPEKLGIPIQEITTSATWFIKGQRLKRLADLPIILHDPVFTENGVGSYAATDLPDQATVLATSMTTAGVTTVTPTGNTVARQNVIEARLMLQAQF